MSTIKRIANVIIPVADQDAELRFYTEVLGLDLRVDAPMGDAGRWIEVAPAGVETVIAICPPGPDMTPGNSQTGITLEVDDIDAFHAKLKDGGVDIDDEVSRFGEGIPPLVWFRDPENNTLMAAQG